MGKGKRKASKQAATPPLPAPSAGAEILRRAVLGLITALIVARPLVRGEDPGFLDPWRDPGAMFLTWLWLVAAFGWAVWRLWSRRGAWLGGAVEIGLLVTVVCVFLSASRAARYTYPAWLCSWEWVGILVAFCLVRQMTVPSMDAHGPAGMAAAQTRQREQSGLLAAIVATAVALSAQSVGQQLFSSPRPDRFAEEEIVFVDGFAQDSRDGGPTTASATFGSADGLAGYLVLMLPAAVGFALVNWRTQGKTRLTWLALACAGIMAVAVLLTGSRSAILAILLTAAVIVAWTWREWLGKRKVVVAIGVAAVAGAFVTVGLLGWESEAVAALVQPLRQRLGERPATWAIIRDYPWFGVGPGNFGRYYPKYVAANAYEQLEVPHGLFVEIWATCGIFALLGILLALTAFFWQTLSYAMTSKSVPVPLPVSEGQSGPGMGPGICTGPGMGTGTDLETEPATNWDIYLSGMAGLLLGFVLRVVYLPHAEIPVEGAWGAFRAIVWFAAFGVLERISWTGRTRVLALSAGVAALLLHLTLAQGISFPAVVQPLWVIAALALNLREPPPESWTSRLWLGQFLPVPLLGTVAMVYFGLVFYPAAQGESAYRSARRAGHEYMEREITLAREEKKPRARPADLVKALQERVIKPLEEVAAANPDAKYQLELAKWYGLLARLQPRNLAFMTKATWYALGARRLDPAGRDGYILDAQLLAQYGQYRLQRIGRYQVANLLWGPNLVFSPMQPLGCCMELLVVRGLRSDARGVLLNAALAYREAIGCDPNNPRLHARRAEVLFLVGNKAEARDEAEKAEELDQQTENPLRKLTQQQREQVRARLDAASSP
jgi:tetratricopeptide (TPR) repeat protein